MPGAALRGQQPVPAQLAALPHRLARLLPKLSPLKVRPEVQAVAFRSSPPSDRPRPLRQSPDLGERASRFWVGHHGRFPPVWSPAPPQSRRWRRIRRRYPSPALLICLGLPPPRWCAWRLLALPLRVRGEEEGQLVAVAHRKQEALQSLYHRWPHGLPPLAWRLPPHTGIVRVCPVSRLQAGPSCRSRSAAASHQLVAWRRVTPGGPIAALPCDGRLSTPCSTSPAQRHRPAPGRYRSRTSGRDCTERWNGPAWPHDRTILRP